MQNLIPQIKKNSVTDFNECNSTWNDCSEHAICIDEFPGYRCACEDEYVDFSSQESRAPGRFCIHPGIVMKFYSPSCPGQKTAKEPAVLVVFESSSHLPSCLSHAVEGSHFFI